MRRRSLLLSILIGCFYLGYSVPYNLKPPLFEFHSGFWINLHHYLYSQALLKKGSGSRRLIYGDSIRLNNLSNAERQQWQTAIDYYSQNLADKDLLFDSSMVVTKDILEDNENRLTLTGTKLPTELESILNRVAPSYRVLIWPQQDRANQLWITAAQSLVQKYGDTMARELAGLYLTPWPRTAIRVDVTNYASWSGAYTTLNPNRIVLSSVDSANQQQAALEVVFHEASHILIDSVATRIDDICRQDNRSLPNKALWHAVLFYTTGEVVRRHLPGYVPYAYKNGLWKRAWPMYIGALEADWMPYVAGTISYEPAIELLVRQVEADNSRK
jgi:hypothetical protein